MVDDILMFASATAFSLLCKKHASDLLFNSNVYMLLALTVFADQKTKVHFLRYLTLNMNVFLCPQHLNL